MNKKFNVSTPSGFPEFCPKREKVRQQWIKVISETYASHGFQPIYTPLVERDENLVGKGGNPKEIYALRRLQATDEDKSHSGNALRFDHTVPLALYVARHLNDISFPFRRQAIGPVFRGERAQKGRYRQFDQCDIDVIGSENLSFFHDAEMVAIITKIFTKLNIGEFVIRINNRKILTGFFADLGISADKIKPVLDIVDDLEKLPPAKIMENFAEQGLTNDQTNKILEFTNVTGEPTEILNYLKGINGGEDFTTGVQELETVLTGIKALKVPAQNFIVDLKIARGLDYYTGTVYETKLVGHESLGSICSGGRYNDLAKIFTKKNLPGVGISIGLTRLLGQLFDAGIIQADTASPSHILVVPQDEKLVPNAIELSQQIRDILGLSVETYLDKKKFVKKLDYADKLGIPFVAIIGEREIENNSFVLKNMTTGEQNTHSIENIESIMGELIVF